MEPGRHQQVRIVPGLHVVVGRVGEDVVVVGLVVGIAPLVVLAGGQGDGLVQHGRDHIHERDGRHHTLPQIGRRWYDEGKLLKKWNTFHDFIECARFLVEQDYTSSDRLFAMGGSAGGLLTGVVLNETPDLFLGVISDVAFVDVVTTMLDESIPLTTGEYDEWGNPNDKQYYDYILSYSPYDQVKAQGYPHMLMTAGLHDSQVQYWEPAKWVAKLRALKTDQNQLYLKTNMEAGHGGQSGRFRRYRETALAYAFMLDLAPAAK